MVCYSWRESRHWEENVAAFTSDIVERNKRVFGNIGRRKRMLLDKLDKLNHCGTLNTQLEKQRVEVWGELEQCLVQEEIMWLQRSRCQWYANGDKNTRFHNVTNSRRRRKNIKHYKKKMGCGVIMRRN